MIMDVVWEEPPASALVPQRRGLYRDFAMALRDNPKAWAILPGERKNDESALNTCRNVRSGKMIDFPKGAFECVVDGSKVYVRFIGDPPLAPPTDEELTAAIRAWGVEHGMEVPSRGRLSQELLTAYHEAQSTPD